MEHPRAVEQVVATAYQLAVTKYDWDLIAADMEQSVFGPLFNEVA